MSRYDYLENPQVQYWKGRFEELRDVLNVELEKIEEGVERLRKERNELSEKNLELQEDIKFFNSLPWYEKIFHKFN